MSRNYKLKSGQINFENQDHSGSYSCVVIKDGVFHNMNANLLKLLEQAIEDHKRGNLKAELTLPNGPEIDELDIDDMF